MGRGRKDSGMALNFKPLKFLLIGAAAVTLGVLFVCPARNWRRISCRCCRLWLPWRVFCGGDVALNFLRGVALAGTVLVVLGRPRAHGLFRSAATVYIPDDDLVVRGNAIGGLAFWCRWWRPGVRRQYADATLPALATNRRRFVMAWQCLLTGLQPLTPPKRSTRDLVAAIPAAGSGPRTPLYNIGQYRETLSPYLARTLTHCGFSSVSSDFAGARSPGINLLKCRQSLWRVGTRRRRRHRFFRPAQVGSPYRRIRPAGAGRGRGQHMRRGEPVMKIADFSVSFSGWRAVECAGAVMVEGRHQSQWTAGGFRPGRACPRR